jgi:hypothetical protein
MRFSQILCRKNAGKKNPHPKLKMLPELQQKHRTEQAKTGGKPFRPATEFTIINNYYQRLDDE